MVLIVRFLLYSCPILRGTRKMWSYNNHVWSCVVRCQSTVILPGTYDESNISSSLKPLQMVCQNLQARCVPKFASKMLLKLAFSNPQQVTIALLVLEFMWLGFTHSHIYVSPLTKSIYRCLNIPDKLCQITFPNSNILLLTLTQLSPMHKDIGST